MKNFISNLSTRKAAMAVGVTFITSVLIVTLIEDFLLPNFIIRGDKEALANDIQAFGKLFGFAFVGYFLVLALDSIIGLALYVVLDPANKNFTLLTMPSIKSIMAMAELTLSTWLIVKRNGLPENNR